MIRPLATAALLVAFGGAGCVASLALSGSPPAVASHTSGSYLGIDLRDIAEDQVAALKLHDAHGAEIVLVDHDAPAGKSGLREHDVILQMNGQPVMNQDQARRMLHDCLPGRMVFLTISRDGQMLPFTARMSTREEVERRAWEQHIPVPEPQDPATSAFAASGPAVPATIAPAPSLRAGNSFIGSLLMSSSYTGVMLEQLNKQLAQFFGAPGGSGLLVRSVADNSPAAQAGLHVGDVVIRANDRTVVSPGDWSKAVKSSHGRPLAVTVLRDKKEQVLTLTPDGKRRSALELLVAAPERTVVARLNLSWLPGR
ncbi:MAG: hypothetical protein NVSMB62_20020 [Acidobacteriaceae bacterium]